MITSGQIRAGRASLRWSSVDLAWHSGVGTATIYDANRSGGLAVAVVKISRDTRSKFMRHQVCREDHTSQKKPTNDFLQNGANIAAQAEMHDKASYQVLKSDEVVVKFSLRINLALIYIAKK